MDSLRILGPRTAPLTREAIARDEQLAREHTTRTWEEIQRRHRRDRPTTDVCARCGGPYSDSPPCCGYGH